MLVTEAVISDWAQQVARSSRDFLVLYVPREREMGKPAAEQDSWRLWLKDVCASHQITFLDPSERLLEAESMGEEVFYDHFTESGHEVFAKSFVEWYREAYGTE